MLHNRRGLLFAAVAALALLVASANTAQAQDAVVRGTITSDRGEPISGANIVIDELRLGVVTNATGQYTLSIPAPRVRGQQTAAQLILRHLWQGTQQGYRPQFGSPDTSVVEQQNIAGYLVPRMAVEMLRGRPANPGAA